MNAIEPIHTINARGHAFLEVMRDTFQLTPDQMVREIQSLRQATADALKTKGVSYSELRSALTPSQDRREVALVFDTLEISDSWYGHQVFEKVIPLLESKARFSILVGDYLGNNDNQLFLERALRSSLRASHDFEFRHSTQFFIVYLNNMTAAQIGKLHFELSSWKPYVGYADTTYESPFKWLLSTMLVNLGVKFGKTIIQGHEDDLPDSEDCNISGMPFEDSGYRCVSIQSIKTGVLLSYKIERPVFGEGDADTEMALNAVGAEPEILTGFQVEVDGRKLEYLKSQKQGSINRASLQHVSAQELATIIKSKVERSYIYNLSYLPEHNVTKFTVMIEHEDGDGNPTRLLTGLSYLPKTKTLRLITLY